MKIYYAHSIRGQHSIGEWKPSDIIPLIKSRHHEVLSEEIYTDTTILSDKEIYTRDVGMIDAADIVLVNITNPSLGVGYELCYAQFSKKPTLCFYQSTITTTVSAMISGNSFFTIHPIATLSELTSLLIAL